MDKLFVFYFALMLAVLPIDTAMAETTMIYGTVVCTQPQLIECAANGAIQQINYAVGDRVKVGDIIATVVTQKVYATMDGTVYLFGEVGDRITDIIEKYGAVAYISPESPYTITATAIDCNGAQVRVTPGEKVYLRCYKDGKHTGQGFLAKLEQGKYTVSVTEGEFEIGETISIYRDESYAASSRIGREKVTITDMVSYKGDGCLVKFHVSNGMEVEKGTLLYETLEGAFVPGSSQHDMIIAPTNGILSAIYEETGYSSSSSVSAAITIQSAEKNEEDVSSDAVSAGKVSRVFAEIYPDSYRRIVAYAPESVIKDIHVNDTVYVSCQYVENMMLPVTGIVEKISGIPSSNSVSVEAQYAVYVIVEDVSNFYYGMNVVVTAGNDD